MGEGLTRPAVRTGRLETGRPDGKYFLRHDDCCAVCGEAVAAGEAFYPDFGSGETFCEAHGRERWGEE
ncbi:hypothetical protein [Halogeometricum salsisoli]|uniref:hypothetical protein n=1 Tax=Halogeometricum salsisoli TaxID=2950536 RepID=UPI003CCDE39E